MFVVIYTTAPEVHDLPETRPLGHAGFLHDGRVVRAVSVALQDGVPQITVYLKSGCAAMTRDEFAAAVAGGGHSDVDLGEEEEIATFYDTA